MTILLIAGLTLAIIWLPGCIIGGYILVLAIRENRRRTVAARVKWAREGSVLAEASQIFEDELRRVMKEVERG
jgi:hypothetical protein